MGRESRGVLSNVTPAIPEIEEVVDSEVTENSDVSEEDETNVVNLESEVETESDGGDTDRMERRESDGVGTDRGEMVDDGAGTDRVDMGFDGGGTGGVEVVDGDIPGGSESSNKLEDTVTNSDSESAVDGYLSAFDSSSDLDTFYSSFNNSLDLETDEEPPRRGTRVRRAPKTLVYDELGKPGLKQRRTKVLVHDGEEKIKKRSKRRPRK